MNLKDNVLLEGKSSEAESIAWGEDGKKGIRPIDIRQDMASLARSG
jgi:hypothetical protein